jgi:hypothetical protein
LRDNRYVPFFQNMHILVYMHLVLSFGYPSSKSCSW